MGENPIDLIHRFAEVLYLSSDVVRDAERIYDKYRKWGRAGYILDEVAIGSLYAAMRRGTCKPVSFHVFCETVGVYRKSVGRVYRKIMWTLGEKPQRCTVQPLIYALNAARKLGLSRKTKHKIEELCKTVIEKRLHVGRSPLTISGGIIYIACNMTRMPRTQREISEALNTSEVAIRHASHYLAINLNIQMDYQYHDLTQKQKTRLVLLAKERRRTEAKERAKAKERQKEKEADNFTIPFWD